MTEPVQLAAIAAASTVFVACCGIVVAKINQVHNLVNSRMTELLEITKKASLAEGLKQGQESPHQGEQS
jgi:hypothetical protein